MKKMKSIIVVICILLAFSITGFLGINIIAIVLRLFLSSDSYESTNEMVTKASEMYGECTVIDKVVMRKYRKVVLVDNLQGFTYEVVQKPEAMFTVDCTDFGHCIRKHDTFEDSLLKYLNDNINDSVQTICKGIATCELNEQHKLCVITFSENIVDDKVIISTVTKVAEQINPYNINGRLNDYCILVERKLDDDQVFTEILGSYYIGKGVYEE